MIADPPPAVRFSLPVIDIDDIEIRMVIELESPHLSHCDNGKSGRSDLSMFIPVRGTAEPFQLALRHPAGHGEACFGQPGQLSGYPALLHVAVNIVDADTQEFLMPVTAQDVESVLEVAG